MKFISGLFFVIALSASVFSQTPDFANASDEWNADEFGNIRAVAEVEAPSNAVRAHIEWRRRDKTPENKNIIVTDSEGNKIANVIRGTLNREFGDVYFQPTKGAGIYYIYYLPYTKSGSANYPKDFYAEFKETADAGWVNSFEKNDTPTIKIKQIEALNAFNTFSPMEIIATKAETERLIAENADKTFLVFPEDRMFSIRMTDDIPQRWVEEGLQTTLKGKPKRGEFFAFQFGILALKDLKNLQINFSDLKSQDGKSITSNNLTCINTNGVDYRGEDFTKQLDIAKNKVQAIWCGLDVSQDAVSATYAGTAEISADGEEAQKLTLLFTVQNEVAENGGFNNPETMSRLKWLNSRMAQENTVIPPYKPITVNGTEINILGRTITLGTDGFPAKIQTYFSPEMTSITKTPKDVLLAPMKFIVQNSAGENLSFKNKSFAFTEKSAGTVKWNAVNSTPNLSMTTNCALEFDGFVFCDVKVNALNDVALKDIRMEIPFNAESSKYIMGLGEKGQRRPEKIAWKWDVANKNQDGAWLGDVNAGMQFTLRDENYVRPLNTNFYLQKPLVLPSSWGNEGKGGIDISHANSSVTVNNYSGERTMKKGQELHYNFTLLITPFHSIDTDWQWANRFYHRYSPPAEVVKTGATVVNIHHATEINPYINYPFIAHKEMKAYIDEAHKRGLKVKIYNTIRELSNHAYETFALRSLGHEIYSPGPGGGFSWLQEHVGDDYIAAWFVPRIKDAAIVNSGMSRWHNYYVEGMNWLVDNVGIDGIYLDDVAFDRVTMKRIKRVLTKNGHPGIIDLHSANQFNKRDGFNNSAMLYMEHFPYLNKLWFGEYFDYENNSPDFFLTEVSGIPFGLMGEMLQDGGNPYRGMIYGMTNRMPWSDDADPRPIWKLWDEFGMKGSKMYGYWSPNVPVKSNNNEVLATVYKKKGTALISIASWAETDVKVRLKFDWKRLGINPKTAKLVAPAVDKFQPAREFAVDDEIPIQKNKGWLLIVK
ncbi:MAG: glycoside hydrolase domain-containing protein [Pyrinomonadaceae bacterium]